MRSTDLSNSDYQNSKSTLDNYRYIIMWVWLSLYHSCASRRVDIGVFSVPSIVVLSTCWNTYATRSCMAVGSLSTLPSTYCILHVRSLPPYSQVVPTHSYLHVPAFQDVYQRWPQILTYVPDHLISLITLSLTKNNPCGGLRRSWTSNPADILEHIRVMFNKTKIKGRSSSVQSHTWVLVIESLDIKPFNREMASPDTESKFNN